MIDHEMEHLQALCYAIAPNVSIEVMVEAFAKGAHFIVVSGATLSWFPCGGIRRTAVQNLELLDGIVPSALQSLASGR